jgi:hypothetical protein
LFASRNLPRVCRNLRKREALVTALLRLAALGAMVCALLAASATPVFGDDTGAVAAHVTVATPCLLIQGPTSLDFGTATFSTPGAASGNALYKNADEGSTLVNCTDAGESVFARATDATGGASWSLQPNLTNPCTAGPDKFSAMSGDNMFSKFLSTANSTFTTLTGGENRPLSFAMYMPCQGSSGAGQTMSFAYIYTVTF